MPHEGADMPCVARPGASLTGHGDHRRRGIGQPVNGKGDPRAGQTELLRSTTSQHLDFYNGPVAGDLGCGKIEVRR
jgi:hypothetical protein